MHRPKSASILSLFLLCITTSFHLQGQDISGDSTSGGVSEPVRLVNPPTPDFTKHDGGLPPVVGVHNIQVMRANRTHTDAVGADGLGWTYNHAPMLCYWNDRFYLEYLTDPIGEHIPPGQTMLMESTNGFHWSKPRVAFPPFTAEGENETTVSHQRMGFYVAPNGRLLMLSFYGRVPRPNNGTGIGRAVREIYTDGTMGPIHFIRYNRHAGFNEDNTPYPFYKSSEDDGFIAACDDLLTDKLMTQQWWEEDRSDDGFYAISGQDRGFDAKALSFYHREDGTVVGLWKKRWAALSFDEGVSWSEPVQIPSLITGGAKIWGQQTADGRYVLVFNPHTAHRWPLVCVSGDDGIVFDDMLVVHGEIPYPRYDGQYKSMGPQYVRGIAEGNGKPPGKTLWLTYSVNKEDIWISYVPLPIRGKVDGDVNDDFDAQPLGLPVAGWNVYSPLWAPVDIVDAPDEDSGRCLELSDEDRYDYAQAVRVFPTSGNPVISFNLRVEAINTTTFEIELADRQGCRPVRLLVDSENELKVRTGDEWVVAGSLSVNDWHKIGLKVDSQSNDFDVQLDGRTIFEESAFAETPASGGMERLCFRTGAFRDYDAHAADLLIDESKLGDRLDGDLKQPLIKVLIDDVSIH